MTFLPYQGPWPCPTCGQGEPEPLDEMQRLGQEFDGDVGKAWCQKAAELEEGCEVGAGRAPVRMLESIKKYGWVDAATGEIQYLISCEEIARSAAALREKASVVTKKLFDALSAICEELEAGNEVDATLIAKTSGREALARAKEAEHE